MKQDFMQEIIWKNSNKVPDIEPTTFLKYESNLFMIRRSVGSVQNYGGKKFQQKKTPTGCPRFDPLFGCCPWTMASNKVEDCPVQVSF